VLFDKHLAIKAGVSVVNQFDSQHLCVQTTLRLSCVSLHSADTLFVLYLLLLLLLQAGQCTE
jgi:hypothetical protein